MKKCDYQPTVITWYMQNIDTVTPTPLLNECKMVKPDSIVAVLSDTQAVWFARVLCVLHSQLKL
jgi:hypothetical protein